MTNKDYSLSERATDNRNTIGINQYNVYLEQMQEQHPMQPLQLNLCQIHYILIQQFWQILHEPRGWNLDDQILGENLVKMDENLVVMLAENRFGTLGENCDVNFDVILVWKVVWVWETWVLWDPVVWL